MFVTNNANSLQPYFTTSYHYIPIYNEFYCSYIYIGNYSLKSRTFYRIKLFNYQTGYIMRTVGTFNKHAKKQKAAFSHLREYIRLRWLRVRYHQWWNKCVEDHNRELAVDHDWERLLRHRLQKWAKWAHDEAHQKRMEDVAIQNKMDFDKRMKEADKDALVLLQLEKDKLAKIEELRLMELEREKEERLKKARDVAQKAKKEERYIIIMAQRYTRRRRVRKEMTAFKKKFAKKWEIKRLEFIDKAKVRLHACPVCPVLSIFYYIDETLHANIDETV